MAVRSAWVSLGLLLGLGSGLAGCGNSSTAASPVQTTTSTSGLATSIYVVQQPASGAGSVLALPAQQNGIVSPSSTLLLPSGFTGSAVAIDNTGQLYVAGTGNSGAAVLVYAAGASGAIAPLRQILGGTNFTAPVALVLDSGAYVYVAGGNASIAVYAPNATGSATPTRLIAGAQTQLNTLQGIAVDGGGNIFVTAASGNAGVVLVFGAGLTGNVAPTRSITQANGVALNNLEGITADGNGDIYVVNYPASGPPGVLLAFAAGAQGNATPAKTIGGGATGLMNVAGITLDGSANAYVVSAAATTAPYGLTVSKFPASDSGNVSPSAIISSSSWTTPVNGQVAVF